MHDKVSQSTLSSLPVATLSRLENTNLVYNAGKFFSGKGLHGPNVFLIGLHGLWPYPFRFEIGRFNGNLDLIGSTGSCSTGDYASGETSADLGSDREGKFRQSLQQG